MRAAVSGLHVLASQVVLPADGEIVKLATQRPGEPVVELPAFAEDPRGAESVPRRIGHRIDRYSALAYASVSRLVAGLDMPAPERVGVFLANTRAGWGYADPQFETMIRKGPWLVQPYLVTGWFPAAGIGEVTIGLGYRGPAKTTTGRLSGFAEALWLARDALERRAIDIAIVGAAESLVASFAMLDWPPGALPTSGAAEGAVVLAVSPWPMTGQGGISRGSAIVHGLRHVGTDRSTASDGDWVPTLSIAAELVQHTAQAADADGDVDMALGGGYHATIRKARTARGERHD
ncbi:MAG TPA: beta-ketoacyl synthase N-terminal-like domain-containing protein [Trebonia sp.]